MSGSEPRAADTRAIPAALPARWFDGRQARGVEVTLALHDGELHVHVDGDESPRRHARARVTWPEPTRHGRRQILLPDGSVVEPLDAGDWDAWAALHGIRQPVAVRWAWSWRASVAALAATLAVLAVGARWGVPWASAQMAPWVPAAARAHLDRSVITQLKENGWLEPHALAPDVAMQLQAAADRMLRSAYPAEARPQIKVDVYRMPRRVGPNAFALPGGQIVVSQALLELLPMQGEQFHPGVLGVVAHEIGHVHQHHGLRQLLAASATGALLGWWIGDYSAVLAGAPALLMQSAYSRGFEREADAEALRIMRAAGIDPRGMVQFFEALERTEPGRAGEGPPLGLATHPPAEERVRLFESGR